MKTFGGNMKKSFKLLLIIISIFCTLIIIFDCIYLFKSLDKTQMADIFGYYPILLEDNPNDILLFKKNNLADLNDLCILYKNNSFLVGLKEVDDIVIGTYLKTIDNLGSFFSFILNNQIYLFIGLFVIYILFDNIESLAKKATNSKFLRLRKE